MKKKKIDLTDQIVNRERIGSILKSFRETNELSQREVARACGYMNANFISMIESGRSAPPIGKLTKLCEAIGCDMAIIPIILKYLYSATWDAVVASVNGCPEIFASNGSDIDQTVEDTYLRLIRDYSTI